MDFIAISHTHKHIHLKGVYIPSQFPGCPFILSSQIILKIKTNTVKERKAVDDCKCMECSGVRGVMVQDLTVLAPLFPFTNPTCMAETAKGK